MDNFSTNAFFLNASRDNRGYEVPIYRDLPKYIPMYVQLGNGTIEPLLTTDPTKPNIPISVRVSGSGFIISSDGRILTNNHVAAGWKSPFDLPQATSMIARPGNKLEIVDGGPPKQVGEWIPISSKQGNFHGENFLLDIYFPNSTQAFPARIMQSSDQHDVALIKIDPLNNLDYLEINDNYETIRVGEPVTVMGYPGVSPDAIAIIESNNPSSSKKKVVKVPEPTVTPGAIGKVIRAGTTAEGRETMTTFDDSYQLTLTATGSGNSGGPTLDNKGRVIGIYYSSRIVGPTRVTFAVPIRYALPLIGRSAHANK